MTKLQMDQKIPIHCRNGPIEERTCTDCFCCLLYLFLILVVLVLGVFLVQLNKIDEKSIQQELLHQTTGKPLLAIKRALPQIVISFAFVGALSLILMILTFMMPSIIIYIIIPAFFILLGLASAIFFMRYLGGVIPLISKQKQDEWAASQSIPTLIVGCILVFTLLTMIAIIISERGKLRHFQYVFRMARICFLNNLSLLVLSILLTIISIVVLAANILILAISQDKQIDEHIIDPSIFGLIVLVEIIWTHGFLEGASEFICEAMTVNWYFTERKNPEDKKCCENLCATLGFFFKHIGSIVFGQILAYVSETLNTKLRQCSRSCACCYNMFCFIHRFTFRNITKYCFIQTTLQSLPFCAANREMVGLKPKARTYFPSLFMMGNFYITLSKIFIIMTTLSLNYVLLAQQKSDLLANDVNLIAPLLVTLFGALQISGHYVNIVGLIGDTIIFLYTVDIEIQKNKFEELAPYSCPREVEEIIHEKKVQQLAEEE